MAADTFPKLLAEKAARYGHRKTAIREKDMGIWQSISWADYYTRVREFSLGLISLGFNRGDVIAVIGDNKPEWLIAELASQCAGGTGVGIYQDSVLPEVEYIINFSGARFVIAEDQEQVDKILDLKESLPAVAKVIYYDPKGLSSYPRDILMGFEDVLEAGREYEKLHPGLFDENLEKVSADDTAWICTTSGTTGKPKLAMLSHRNFITMVTALDQYDPKYESDEFVSILPMPWVGEQMMALATALVAGCTVNFPESVESAREDMREIGPHFIFSPPRVWENIAANVQVRMLDASWLKRACFNWALGIGYRWSECKFSKRVPSILLKLLYGCAYLMVFKPLKDRLGFSNTRSAMTGGAALGPDTFKFFHALGISLKQLYGQTEITGISCIHRGDDINPDTMGMPIPGTELRISGDGEILSRSDAVFKGYYRNDEATAEALRDGWLYSGDAGYLTEDGHIVVIDRIQDLMQLAHGVKFSPQFIENKLKFSPFIKEAVVIGHGRAFLGALVCIDYGIVGNWAERKGIAYTTYTDLSSKPEVYSLIQAEIDKVNAALKDDSRLSRFALLYKELDPDDDELTRTRKVRRGFVEEKYADIINAMYGGLTSIALEAVIKFQDGKTATIRPVIEIRDAARGTKRGDA